MVTPEVSLVEGRSLLVRVSAAKYLAWEIPQDAVKVTPVIAQIDAESEFGKYRIAQDRLFEWDFCQMIKKLPETGLRLTRRRGERGGRSHEGIG